MFSSNKELGIANDIQVPEIVLTNLEIVESVWQKGTFLIHFPPIESFSAINQVADQKHVWMLVELRVTRLTWNTMAKFNWRSFHCGVYLF